MKNANKKAALREKLKSNFEWTAEAIEDINSNGISSPQLKSPQPTAPNQLVFPDLVTKNEAKEDTMEEKIERVQVRKEEAEKRARKRALGPSTLVRVNRSLKEYQTISQTSSQAMNTDKVAKKLNNYFQEYLADKIQEIDGSIRGGRSFICSFPLYFFDVSTYDEILTQPELLEDVSGKVSVRAVCLLSPSQLMELYEKTSSRDGRASPESISFNDGEERSGCIGEWFPCEIIGEEKKNINPILRGNKQHINGQLNIDEKEFDKKSVQANNLIVQISTRMSYQNSENLQKNILENNSEQEEFLQFVVPPMQLYFTGQNLEIYGNRITDALTLRKKCIALNRYHLYIDCMPYDRTITSSLDQNQSDRIRKRCMR